ncbi:hypothetical protein ACGFNX_12250 [Streptomyces sp. NPDC048723]
MRVTDSINGSAARSGGVSSTVASPGTPRIGDHLVPAFAPYF